MLADECGALHSGGIPCVAGTFCILITNGKECLDIFGTAIQIQIKMTRYSHISELCSLEIG